MEKVDFSRDPYTVEVSVNVTPRSVSEVEIEMTD